MSIFRKFINMVDDVDLTILTAPTKALAVVAHNAALLTSKNYRAEVEQEKAAAARYDELVEDLKFTRKFHYMKLGVCEFEAEYRGTMDAIMAIVMYARDKVTGGDE